jgi:hypothetical protein
MGDYCYAVMDKTPKAMTPNRTACPAFPNCTQDCQIDYIEMPPGWELAPCPSNEVTAAMFSGTLYGYAWGADYLLYGGGCFSSTLNGGGAQKYPAMQLEGRGTACKSKHFKLGGRRW